MKEAPLSMILVDIARGEEEFDQSFLERTCDFVVCHGPDHGGLCPILAGTGCQRVDDVHGIVFVFDLQRPQHRAILQRHRHVAK
jgi:hypothetical protein